MRSHARRNVIDGVILAGGASSRMGGPKALLQFGDNRLIDAVIARTDSQVRTLAIDVSRVDVDTYRAQFAQIILPDLYGDKLGPLCGIVTGLTWCRTDWLATFSCDTPFLPRDLVAQLAQHATDTPVVAKGAQVCGLWPKTCLADLKEGLESGALRSVLSAVEALGGTVCAVGAPDHAFFNVNTKDDLAEALRLSALED
ncbi:MAG TPA: molybdenum cofactor guanylyltransferase [Rhizomicrobium sp.]|jgi:molybdopterin-guanine dinucleotide biosynthesis protein A|nr:molybdenum cofactor guanylyltransferase [Rhizomicrobium sp.]